MPSHTENRTMRIYQLHPDVESYRWLSLVDESEFGILSDLNDRSAGASWRPLAVEWIEDELNDGKPDSDFPTLGTTPVMTQRAVDSLLDLLVENGELLPLELGSTRYYAYNVTRNVDALDEGRSEIVRFSSGRVMRVSRYEFYPDRIRDLSIFKLPQLRSDVFATSVFYKRVRDAGLSGFQFTEIWSGVQ